jgi:hypothetical protein
VKSGGKIGSLDVRRILTTEEPTGELGIPLFESISDVRFGRRPFADLDEEEEEERRKSLGGPPV